MTKNSIGTPSRTERSRRKRAVPLRTNDRGVNVPAIRKKSPSPNSPAIAATTVTSDSAGSRSCSSFTTQLPTSVQANVACATMTPTTISTLRLSRYARRPDGKTDVQSSRILACLPLRQRRV